MSDGGWRLIEADPGAWKTVHSVRMRSDTAYGLIFNDGSDVGFHLMHITDPRLAFARVRVTAAVRPLPGCSVNLYFDTWGGQALAVIAPDGRLLRRDPEAEVTVERREDGLLDVTVDYLSLYETVNVGSYGDHSVYAGTGQDLFLFERLQVFVQPYESRFGSEALVLVDVGAEGGLQHKWRPLARDLDLTLVEPSPETAAVLRRDFPRARVLEVALLDRRRRRRLNLTRVPGASSLLEPNTQLLRRWWAGPAFDVVRTVEVRCERYDALHARGMAPAPEALKIDVQGVELEVLRGFGELLHGCLGVELEAHFYPIYRRQKLLHEIIAYLAKFNLALRRLEPQMNFDGDLVEVNAYFTRTLQGHAPELQRRKLSLIEKVWQLHCYDGGRELAGLAGLERAPAPETPIG